MRGKLPDSHQSAPQIRNIPAYAGKTVAHKGSTTQSEEHPRVCGENILIDSTGSPFCGTSPRMRGKQGVTNITIISPGNIPAYAGKTRILYLST